MQVHEGPGWIGYIIMAVVALVLVLRVRGMSRARRLRPGQLWLVPAVALAVLAMSIWEYPPRSAATWVALVTALGAGAAIGWRRGMLMRITVDPATRTLNQQGSPAALLVLVVLIVARQAFRYEGAALGLNVLQTTGVLIAFAVGLLGTTRAEMYLRARRLLAECDAGYTPSGISTGPTTSR